MLREPSVVLAHSPRSWAQELHFFLMDHGGAIVRGYVLSPEAALAESYDVFIVDDVTSFLSRRLVSSLAAKGTAVVGIYDPDDAEGAGKARLLEVGVNEAIPATSSPSDILQVVTTVAGPSISDAPRLEGLLEELTASRDRQRAVVADHDEAAAGRGQIVAVAAASGGSGATELAIGLSQALRRAGHASVLVDADDQSPAVAQRLGLGLHPNIRTAVDAVHHGTGTLERSLVSLPSLGIEVLCGLPNPRDWFELRPGEVAEVILELARARDKVVVNVGPRVEDLPELGGPARFGVTRSAVGLADTVVLVGGTSPVGAGRVIDWLADAESLLAGRSLHVVFNQYPGGSYARSELENEIRRAAKPRSIAFVPFDKRVTRAAWDGEPVVKGPFTKTVSHVAGVVAGSVSRR